MVPFGAEAGDQKVNPGMLTAGLTIDLHMFFPFYGGLYNYTTVSFSGKTKEVAEAWSKHIPKNSDQELDKNFGYEKKE